MLAVHYFDSYSENCFLVQESDQDCSIWRREREYAGVRMYAISSCLGEVAFDEAIAETKKKWDSMFDELEVTPRCKQCGIKHHRDRRCPGT